MAKLIFGCGYLGKRVASRWLDAGEEVFVVTRSEEKAQKLGAAGYRPIVANLMRTATLGKLPVAETVLYAVGYDRDSHVSRRALYVDGLNGVLDALPAETGKFIYISSTGVYGQTDGEWVDEQSPCEPVREGGRNCLAAEGVLAASRWAPMAIVLRMAGLYGPGRVPNRGAIRAGETVSTTAAGFLNLIQVDDAAEIVLAADARAVPPRTYVVSDGAPVERRTYYEELARRLGVLRPRLSAPPARTAASERAASSKRINNARMTAELGVELRYPSYREGLAAAVEPETARGD